MKFGKRIFCAISAILFALTPLMPSLAEEIVGKIEVEDPGMGEAKVEVNLEGAMFALASHMVSEDDPETAEFLAGLKSLRIRIYEMKALGEGKFDDAMDFYKNQLEGAKWNVIARVKEEDSKVGVYSLMKDDYIAGLTVLVSNAEDLIVVNLAGKIDITKLSKLAKMANIEGLEELSELASKIEPHEPSLTIRGVVIDAKTGEPIEGVKVSDGDYGEEPRKGTITDAEGNYAYKTWYEEHFIVAEMDGYKTKRRLLATKVVGKETEMVMDFELEQKMDDD